MMTCLEARARLAALLYGDLPAEEAEAVRKHLAGCSACLAEQAALRRIRRLLDEAPAPPEVHVDVPRLLEEAAARRARVRRRWRRAAGGVAVAAAILLVLFLKFQVRVESQQLVIRWGAVAEAPPAPTIPAPHHEMLQPEVTAADFQLLRQLVHALAENVELLDADHKQDVARLDERLNQIEQQAQQRWHATERLVSAVATIQLDAQKRGGQ
jgi:anti-sigma factor RsiW